jgi:hypothetical protein
LHINDIVPDPGIIILDISLPNDSQPNSLLNTLSFPPTFNIISKGNRFSLSPLLNKPYDSRINLLLNPEVITDNKIPKQPKK